MTEYVPALRRFWWVLVLGLLVAAAAALSALYSIPSFERREQPSYVATARLLVTGPQAPYLRAAITTSQELTRDASAAGPVPRAGSETTTVLQTSPPDVQPFVRAANLYPLFIESDQVKAERERLFGPTGGTVSARAIYSVSTASRFTGSEVPVIQVFGEDASPEEAIAVTTQTATAFMSWIKGEQAKAQVPARQRILITNIQKPSEAFPTSTPSPLLGIIAFAGVFFAFLLLAIALDRLYPRRSADTDVEEIGLADDRSDVESVPRVATGDPRDRTRTEPAAVEESVSVGARRRL